MALLDPREHILHLNVSKSGSVPIRTTESSEQIWNTDGEVQIPTIEDGPHPSCINLLMMQLLKFCSCAKVSELFSVIKATLLGFSINWYVVNEMLKNNRTWMFISEARSLPNGSKLIMREYVKEYLLKRTTGSPTNSKIRFHGSMAMILIWNDTTMLATVLLWKWTGQKKQVQFGRLY